MSSLTRFSLLSLAASFGLAACGGSSVTSTTPDGPAAAAQVVSVSPVGGAINVSTAGPIVVGFSHGMHAGSEMYVTLHQGTATGTLVAGHAMWSADSTQLTFTPTAALAAHTMYALHIGGNMMDDAGKPADLSKCPQFGGQAATSQMMSGGMMGGSEMGSGWQTPGGNTYGMVFTFTTQ